MLKLQRALFVPTCIGIIFLITGILQNQLSLRSDVSWLIHATERMLAGGTYVTDFFEGDPPLILYLNIPIIALKKFLPFTLANLTRIYLYSLIAVSLALCSNLIKKIIPARDHVIEKILFISCALILLLFPLTEFGQREHLMLILSLPYLFLIANRLMNIQVSKILAGSIGLLAGIGFAIKPYYFLTPFLLELYLLLDSKQGRVIFRTENFIMLLFLCVYIPAIFILHPDYVNIIVPFALDLYYQSLGQPIQLLLLYPPAVFSLNVVLLYGIFFKKLPYFHLTTTLLIATISFQLIFYYQDILFFYHLLPAFALALLTIVFMLGLIFKQRNLSSQEIIWLALLINLNLLFFYILNNAMWTVIVFNPYLFFSFCAALFGIHLYVAQDKKDLKLTLSCTLLLTIVGIFFSSLTKFTEFNTHRFLLTFFFFFLGYTLCLSIFSKRCFHYLFLTIVSGTLLIFPTYIMNALYGVDKLRNMRVNTIVDFINAQAARSIYIFSHTIDAYPGLDNLPTINASRFPFFWMIIGLIHPHDQSKNTEQKNIQLKQFLMQMIISDLNEKKPEYVIVDELPNFKLMKFESQGHISIEPISFSYVEYFLTDEGFRQAWAHYRPYKVLSSDGPSSTKFRVYARVS